MLPFLGKKVLEIQNQICSFIVLSHCEAILYCQKNKVVKECLKHCIWKVRDKLGFFFFGFTVRKRESARAQKGGGLEDLRQVNIFNLKSIDRGVSSIKRRFGKMPRSSNSDT